MIKQVSVFLENRAGRLNYLLKLLSDNDINISSLSIAETGEYGIARLITEDAEKTVKVISEAGMTASEANVIALEVSDTPGALYRATQLLSDNDINVEYAYSAIPRKSGKATVIIRTDNTERAAALLDEAEEFSSLNEI